MEPIDRVTREGDGVLTRDQARLDLDGLQRPDGRRTQPVELAQRDLIHHICGLEAALGLVHRSKNR